MSKSKSKSLSTGKSDAERAVEHGMAPRSDLTRTIGPFLSRHERRADVATMGAAGSDLFVVRLEGYYTLDGRGSKHWHTINTATFHDGEGAIMAGVIMAWTRSGILPSGPFQYLTSDGLAWLEAQIGRTHNTTVDIFTGEEC